MCVPCQSGPLTRVPRPQVSPHEEAAVMRLLHLGHPMRLIKDYKELVYATKFYELANPAPAPPPPRPAANAGGNIRHQRRAGPPDGKAPDGKGQAAPKPPTDKNTVAAPAAAAARSAAPVAPNLRAAQPPQAQARK